MKLHNLTNTIAATAIATVAACFISEAAHARQAVGVSGNSTNGSFISFEIDPTLSSPSGTFTNAIQNFESKLRVNVGYLQQSIGFNAGSLKSSVINSDDMTKFGLDSSYSNGVRYKASFDTSVNNITLKKYEDQVAGINITRELTEQEIQDFELNIFVPSTNPALLTNLSDLSNLGLFPNGITVAYGFPSNSKNQIFKPEEYASPNSSFILKVIKKPETGVKLNKPSAVGSFAVLATFGIMLALKRRMSHT